MILYLKIRTPITNEPLENLPRSWNLSIYDRWMKSEEIEPNWKLFQDLNIIYSYAIWRGILSWNASILLSLWSENVEFVFNSKSSRCEIRFKQCFLFVQTANFKILIVFDLNIKLNFEYMANDLFLRLFALIRFFLKFIFNNLY